MGLKDGIAKVVFVTEWDEEQPNIEFLINEAIQENIAFGLPFDIKMSNAISGMSIGDKSISKSVCNALLLYKPLEADETEFDKVFSRHGVCSKCGGERKVNDAGICGACFYKNLNDAEDHSDLFDNTITLEATDEQS